MRNIFSQIILIAILQLCDYAQAWANHLAHTNKFYYRNDRDVGQNLYQRPVSALQPEITGIHDVDITYKIFKRS